MKHFIVLVLALLIAGCGGSPYGFSSLGAGSNAENGTVCKGSGCVSLGASGEYVILAKTGITNTPTSAITGNLGVSPNKASSITGLAITLPSASYVSTSAQVTGGVYAADYAAPTPANLTKAIADMMTAYTSAAGLPAGVGPNLNLGGGTVSGQTLAPGTYTWGTAVTIPTDLTLNGSATDVWVFQIAGALSQASAKKVILTGGALPQNVFWQVAGGVSIGTTAEFQGIVLSQTAITLGTGATEKGRLFAQSAVNLDSNKVVTP